VRFAFVSLSYAHILFAAYKQVYRSLRGVYHRINRERFAAESPVL